jgi:hypothetical protein
LHDFEDLNLDEFETAAIAVNKVPEKVQQLRLVIRRIAFLFDGIAHELDEFKDLGLIVEHVLVIVVHLFEEIDTADILFNMLQHFGYFLNHDNLDFVEVLNQGHNKLVTQVEQLECEFFFRQLLAVENVGQNFRVQICTKNNVLLYLVGARALHCEVEQFICCKVVVAR